MKLKMKALALMGALAAGVAGAAAPTANTTSTAVNTSISNTASATFTDPSTGNPIANPINSNTVITTVLPQPSFDIVYGSSKADGSGDPTSAANSVSNDTPDKATVQPGKTATDTYYVVNNGNTALQVALTSATSGNPKSVTYTWTDSTGTYTNVTGGTVTLPVGGVIEVTQTITIPDDAQPNTGDTPQYGATPVGSVAGTGTTVTQNADGTSTVTGNGIPTTGTTTTLYENQTLNPDGTLKAGSPAQNTDLQYQAVIVYNPKLTNNPNPNPVAPPSGTTPDGGTPSYDGGTPSTITPPPNNGTTPGTTPITITGDKQIAYPPSDNNGTADVVDFTNSVTNGGTAQDVIGLTPTGDGWTKNGTGTWTNNGVTVQFLDSNGNPVDNLTVAPNQSATYTTQVTYPDSNSVTNPNPIDVVIKATSGNNPNVSDTTTDTIMPPAASFGDTAAVPQANGVVESPATPFYPGSSTTPVTTAPGGTASFPMSISNTGTYPDSYTLQGYVVIPLATPTDSGATTVTVPVTYTSAGTVTVTQTGSTTVNGVTVPVYTTSSIPAGQFANFTATVAVPAGAAQTTTTSNASATAPAAPALQQTATSVYSQANAGTNNGLVMTDLNDLLPISSTGGVVVGKFTQAAIPLGNTPAAGNQFTSGSIKCTTTAPATAATTTVSNPVGYTCDNTAYQPGQSYSYQIVAKNNYNTAITGFKLTDDLTGKPFDLTAVTGSCSTGGTFTFNNNIATCDFGTNPIATGATPSMTVNVTIK